MKKNRKRKPIKKAKWYYLSPYKITIGSLLIGGIGIFLSYLSYVTAKDIAIDTGAYDKPIVKMMVGNMNLRKENNAITIGAPHIYSYSNKIIPITSIPYRIMNMGQQNLENLYFTLKYNKIFKRNALEHLDYINESVIEESITSRVFKEIGDHHFISYYFKTLNPKVHAEIDEPVVLHETKFQTYVKFNSKDNVPLGMDVTVDFAETIELSVSGKDIPNKNYMLNISMINANSKEHLLKKVLERINQKAKEIREKESFFKYLGKLMLFNNIVEEFIIFPNLKKTMDSGLSVYFDADPDFETIKYKLYSWKLLL